GDNRFSRIHDLVAPPPGHFGQARRLLVPAWTERSILKRGSRLCELGGHRDREPSSIAGRFRLNGLFCSSDHSLSGLESSRAQCPRLLNDPRPQSFRQDEQVACLLKLFVPGSLFSRKSTDPADP